LPVLKAKGITPCWEARYADVSHAGTGSTESADNGDESDGDKESDNEEDAEIVEEDVIFIDAYMFTLP
jgi:hypothetical protein